MLEKHITFTKLDIIIIVKLDDRHILYLYAVVEVYIQKG